MQSARICQIFWQPITSQDFSSFYQSFQLVKFYETARPWCAFWGTVEPHYNGDPEAMKITLLSWGKKTQEYKEPEPAQNLVI